MKRLIELAEKIKDQDLRKKVLEFLRDPKLSSAAFKKYKGVPIEKAGSVFTVSGPGGSSSVERDVLNHTVTLANLCLKTADTIEENYGVKINKDYLTAAAILHDISKIFEWKRGPQGFEHTGVMLDHTMLGVAELYHRNFPEGVIHIVASHFGENGPTPPRNFEALLFHHLDSMVSLIEFHVYGAKQEQPMQLVLFDEEMLRKLGEKTEEKP